jgi:protein-S-isoprenylcysteine O-methyltransferase Ste14
MLLLALFWALWCTLHSLLASTWVTIRVRKLWGRRFAWFRLFYNLFALFSLVPILVWSTSLPYGPVLTWPGPWKWVRALCLVLAAGLLLAGARVYPLGEFLGVRQLRGLFGGGTTQAGEEERLVKTGILGVIRHPWYLAVLILLWSRNLSPQDLVTSGILSLYVQIGARIEEERLLKEFGEEFRQYRREVSMILPWKWVRARWIGFFRSPGKE